MTFMILCRAVYAEGEVTDRCDADEATAHKKKDAELATWMRGSLASRLPRIRCPASCIL